jgi:hypothetical protein
MVCRRGTDEASHEKFLASSLLTQGQPHGGLANALDTRHKPRNHCSRGRYWVSPGRREVMTFHVCAKSRAVAHVCRSWSYLTALGPE